ncbi:MAG: condensation domain-containing protein [Cyanobacteria bacterium P01_G01_bin.39]
MSQNAPTNFWHAVKQNIVNQRQKPPIKPVSQNKNLKIPLSYNQEQLWQLDQLNPSSVHNVANALRLSFQLNFIALEKSLQEIVRRHAILRTTFPIVDGKPYQNITDAAIFQIPALDLRQLSEAEKQEHAKQIAVTEKQRPFNLTQETAFRVKLLRLADDESVLLLTMHHLIFDGSSFSILFKELKLLYAAFAQHKPSPLPELPIQYGDFAYWQRQCLEDTQANASLIYWKEKLAGEIQPLQLPTDNYKTSVFNYQGSSQYLKLSSSLTQKLKALSVEQRITLFTTLLTAFNTLIYCYTKQKDLILVSPIEGRDRPETKNVIGYFNNLLILRNNLDNNPTFLQLLQRVNQTVLNARENQDIPFKMLAEIPALANSPLSRAMFAFSNYKMRTLELSGIVPTSLDIRDVQQETSNFDLSLSMSVQGEQLTGIIRYKTELFKQETITKLKYNFISLLESIITNPKVNLQDLPSFKNSNQTNIKSLLNQQKSEVNFTAPRSELEQKIQNIWQKILATESISIHDNFFDLGGHSLTSIKLILELEKAFQQKLPWSIFSQLTNIEEQASLISTEGLASTLDKAKSLEIANYPTFKDAKYRQLLALTSGWNAKRMHQEGLIVGLNTAGAKPPFFWSAGAFREISPLAKHLGTEHPVYGLFNGYGVLQPTAKNIAILADHYVLEMMSLQKDEPYYLGGYCLGGLLAFEIAQRLQKQGKKVASLILVDSYPPRNYNDSLTLIFGRESYKNPYRLQPQIAIDWSQQLRNKFEVHLVPGNHRLLDDYLVAETAAKLKMCLNQTQIAQRSQPTEINLADKTQIITISNIVAPAGTTLIIPITLKKLCSNYSLSTSTLPNMSLVSRWLNQDGEFIPWDDNRLQLPQTIEPNSEIEVSFPVTTPLTPGSHILELSLTHLGLIWFGNQDSGKIEVAVEVTQNESSTYQAKFITPERLEVSTGKTSILPISVQNISSCPWLCHDESPIRLISNLFDQSGKAVSWNDSDRGIKLPKCVQAQEIIKLDLPITAPLKSGFYFLQLDLNQFGTSWFKSQNLPLTKIAVEVIADRVSNCQAQISAQKHLTVTAGAITNLPVKVKNLSSLTWLWERQSHIYLGNHWLNRDRKTIRGEDGLTELPRNLSPQEEIELSLKVTAPLKPDSYFLEIDLWQKGVTWFKQQGSQTAIVQVEVTDAKGSAFRASISAQKYLQVRVGQTATLSVKVKNLSSATWQSSPESLIQLGNHWLDEQGNKILKWDDGRVPIGNIKPQQEVELLLNVTAPLNANPYLLELDLVQEGVTWFKKQGSQTTIVEVETMEE